MGFPLEPPSLVPESATSRSAEDPFADDPVLKDITETGPVYQQHDSRTSFTENVHRMWDERGDFSTVTIANISNSRPSDNTSSTRDGETSKAPHGLTESGLWDLKSELLQDIGTARQTIIQAAHFLDLVIPSNVPNVSRDQDLKLPADSLRTSSMHVPPPNPPPTTLANNLALGLGTTRTSLRETSQTFANASKRLGRLTRDNEKWWDEWKSLHARGVKILPRGARKGAKLVGAMSEYLAKDLAAFCAAEEGSANWRPAAFATLESSKATESSADNEQSVSSYKLKLPERTMGIRRLKITLQKSDYSFSSRTRGPSLPTEIEPHASKNLNLVYCTQEELLDEELFDLLVTEVKTDKNVASSSKVKLDQESFEIQANSDCKLIVELEHANEEEEVGHDEDENKMKSDDPEKESLTAFPNLIKALLRLILLERYRQSRSLSSTKPSSSSTSSTSKTTSKTTNTRILSPILNLFMYHSLVTRLSPIIQKTLNHLSNLDIPASQNWMPSIVTMEDFLKDFTMGGLASIILDPQHVIQFSLSSPDSLNFHMASTSVPISSPDHLESILSAYLTRHVISIWIPHLLQQNGITGSSQVFTAKFNLENGFSVWATTDPNININNNNIDDHFTNSSSNDVPPPAYNNSTYSQFPQTPSITFSDWIRFVSPKSPPHI